MPNSVYQGKYYIVDPQSQPQTAVLFVGGPLDGQHIVYYSPTFIALTFHPANDTDWEVHALPIESRNTTYTRRTLRNTSGNVITVYAEDNIKGYKVLQMLASKYYTNNPLYCAK